MNVSRQTLTFVLATLAAAAAVATGAAAAADTRGDVTWHARIDGRDIATATSDSPVPLHAGRDAAVTLTVENHGTEPVEVRAVRLDGRVLGMSFFTFSSRIDLVVAPGATQVRGIDVDLGDLGDQATGLIPGAVSLVGQDRTVFSQKPVATDVRGSLLSPYGAFGLIVGAVTLVLVLSLAWEIARLRLPANRWRRAVRFLAPGLGLGFSATFTLSATRVLNPSASAWVPLVVGCGLTAFVVGYLTPAPGDGTDVLEAVPQAELEPLDDAWFVAAEPMPAAARVRRPADLRLPPADGGSALTDVDVTALEPGSTSTASG
jgi:hypothetical protein